MKCDDGGTLTDATATGDAPTTSDLITYECTNSGSVDWCAQSSDEVQATCGCSEREVNGKSGTALMNAAGSPAAIISGPDFCEYHVEGGEPTNTVPDGYDWKCWKCPDGMQVRSQSPSNFSTPTCVGCPSGTQFAVCMVCVCVRACLPCT